MSRRKVTTANSVLAVLQQAQLYCRGEFPVVVKLDGKEVEFVGAAFNQNSGNVELSVRSK